MGFPCNQFGKNEPGADSTIKDWYLTLGEVTYPIFNKVTVNGKGASPLWLFL